jgi:hypothetical protein
MTALASQNLILAAIVVIFNPYLSRPSKLRREGAPKCIWTVNLGGEAGGGDVVNETKTRSFWHASVWTSYIYGIAGLLAIALNQGALGSLCLWTCLSSTVYHLNCESRYFNQDNIFATSLMVTFVRTMYVCFHDNESPWSFEIFAAGMLGLPVALFLLVYCGMPAEVEFDKSKDCLCRRDRPLYNYVHSIWHIVSAAGPFLSVIYFATAPSAPAGAYLDPYELVPIVPASALLISLSINLLGNYLGIMPLD